MRKELPTWLVVVIIVVAIVIVGGNFLEGNETSTRNQGNTRDGAANG
jgi:hypothetical protein